MWSKKAPTQYRNLKPIKGHRKDLPEVNEFQSQMEANAYRFYKWRGVPIEYEPTWFRFPENKYNIFGFIPDFKIRIGKFTYYIEVKGVMDANAQAKTLLFRKHYPQHKLYFIEYPQYNLIKKHYSKLIPNWE